MAETSERAVAAAATAQDARKVFVIYGRNTKARREVFTFLRSIGLDPMEWSQAAEMTGEASPYIGDVLTKMLEVAQAIVVLLTPDDIVYLDTELCGEDEEESRPQPQPRPNVLFEAGMAMAVSPKRTVIVEFGNVKQFTDISGRHRIRLDNSHAKRQELANRLKTAGCSVNMTGTDWHDAADLTPPNAGLPRGKKFAKSDEPKAPVLDARLIDRGPKKMGAIEIINRGPGAIHGLTVTDFPTVVRGRLVEMEGVLPVPKLPAGKSVAVINYTDFGGWGEASPSHLTFTVLGSTDDGEEVRQEVFVSLGAR